MIFPWNASASFRLWTVIGFLALTEMKTRAERRRAVRVSGAVKSLQRSFADVGALGQRHHPRERQEQPRVTQNVTFSTERLMNSG